MSLADRLDAASYAPPLPTAEGSSPAPEVSQTQETLAELAAKRHAAFAAKINAPVFGERKKELMAAYESAEDAYLNALRADVGNEIYSADLDAVSDDEIFESFEDRINSLRQADREAEKAELLAQGGKKAELLNWYANLPRRKKIAVTAGLAVGGAAASIIATSTGVATVAAATVFGGYRLTRGYAMRVSKIYRDDSELPTFGADNEQEIPAMIESGIEFLKNNSRETIEQAEKIKKRATLGAVGAVALGSAAGWGIRETLNETGAGEYIAEKAASWKEKLSGVSFFPNAYATEFKIPEMMNREAVDEQAVDKPIVDDTLSGRNAHLYGRSDVVEVPDTAEPNVQLEALQGTFTVEAGHGYTHELMETVEAAYGVKLTPEEAWELHQELVRTSGKDYIDLLDHKGADTYDMGGSKYNVGLAAGGQAEWDAEALEHIDQKFGTDVSAEPTVTDTSSAEAEAEVTEAPTTPNAQDRNLVSGTGGTDYETPAPEPGTLVTPPVDGETLKGMVEAEQDNAAGSVSWEDMKQDTQEMRGMLLGGDIASINEDMKFQDTLDYIQNDIGDMTYEGTDIKVIEQVGSGFDARWQINEAPAGQEMPGRVIELFDAYVRSLKVLAP